MSDIEKKNKCHVERLFSKASKFKGEVPWHYALVYKDTKGGIMAKQGDIREGIAKALFNYDMAIEKHRGDSARRGLIRVHFLEDIFSYLHSQGVVIKTAEGIEKLNSI